MKDIFNCKVPRGKGVIGVLNSSGDTKLFWNKKNAEEVENARQMFDKLVKGKKFAAFEISQMGKKSKKVTEFNPNLQKLILIPPMAGGQNIRMAEASRSFDSECVEVTKAAEPHNEEAEIKAMALLKKKIGEQKFIKFVAVGYIEIKGKYGVYKIRKNEEIELHKFDIIGKKKRPLFYGLCIDVSKKAGYIPQGDKTLTLYLSITEDEDKFIETANFRRVRTKDEYNERLT